MASIRESRAAFTHHARGLAEAASGVKVRPAEPTKGVATRFTTSAWFFDAGDRLIVVAGPCDGLEAQAHDGEARRTNRDPDLALAYGLAHAGNRPLTVVVPTLTSYPTLVRLPWVTGVEVYTYDFDVVAHDKGYGSVEPGARLTPEATLAAYRQAQPNEADHLGGDFAAAFLGQRTQFVTPLLRWLDADPELVPAHRQSYLAWHCEGRMVLRIKRMRGGRLGLSAGVHDGTAHSEVVGQELTPAQVHRIIGHVALAAANRLDGTDPGHGEHRLQARLLDALGDIGIEMAQREYPAWRPSNDPLRPSRAFIDFLGGDQQGRLRIVETKIGNDEMLVLQGLDYWIWANANSASLAERFGVPPVGVHVDFVCAPKKNAAAIGPYSAAQADRLARSVSHRFYRVEGWEDGDPEFVRVAGEAP